MKKITIIVLCLALFSAPAWTIDKRTAESDGGRFQAYLLQGISKSFNLDEDGADVLLKKAIALEPENPVGYALEAMLHMFAYEMCFTPEQRREEKDAIFHYAGETLAKGAKRLAANPKDSQAYFAVALAKIARVHWAIQEKRYFVMARETLNIWNSLEAAKAADPANYDADYLMGFLRYSIDNFRGVTGVISSMLITQGNRQKGLMEMQTASQKGTLMRDMAQIQLASTYLNYEKQPARALTLIQELRKKYPDNYSFHFLHAVALMELKRFDEAEAQAMQIRDLISIGKPPYVRELEPRYYQLLGRIHQKKGEYEKARLLYLKAMGDQSFYNTRTVARSLLYLGKLADIREDRKTAEDYYNRVLTLEGADAGPRMEAKKYLKSPYRSGAE